MFQRHLICRAAATGASLSMSRLLRSDRRPVPPTFDDGPAPSPAPRDAADTAASEARARDTEGWRPGHTASQPRYGAEEYNFMEKVQALGARKALKGTHNRLVIYGIIGGACALYLFYFLTTRTYVLTTDKSPFKNSMFQHFPSDYAIVENRWTGRQTIECVEEADAAASATDSGASTAQLSATNSIVTRQIHTNILLHRVHLYLQPTNVVVVLDTTDELQPFRFVKGSIDVRRQSTAGWQRTDQRFADPTDDATVPARTHWWQPWRRPTAHTAIEATSTASGEKKKLYIESRVRLLDDYNGYQRGSKPTYENTLQTVTKTCLATHYRERIIARGAAEVRPAYAEVMLQNGSLNGEGITLSETIPDLEAFNNEVFDEVAKRMGDRILLYTHTMRKF